MSCTRSDARIGCLSQRPPTGSWPTHLPREGGRDRSARSRWRLTRRVRVMYGPWGWSGGAPMPTVKERAMAVQQQSLGADGRQQPPFPIEEEA